MLSLQSKSDLAHQNVNCLNKSSLYIQELSFVCLCISCGYMAYI